MSRIHTSQIVTMLVAALLVQIAHSTQSVAGRFMDQTGCSQCCPECKHVCKLDVEKVEEERKCFEVESKVICIPRVVFPWERKSVQKSCDSCDSCDGRGCNTCCHKGAKTRKVKVLSSRKYKCPKCEYTWSAEKKPCSPCASGCCDTGCSTGCDHLGYEVQGETYPLPVLSDEQMIETTEVPSYSDEDSTGLESIEVHHP